jgi:RecA-family ATPase
MKHLVGMDDATWRQQRTAAPIVLDTDQLINSHMLLAGMSGTGKSYQIMSLLNAAANQGIEGDAFDVHE